MWPGSHGVVVNPQEGLMEWSVFDMDPYVNPYVDFRGVALNPGCSRWIMASSIAYQIYQIAFQIWDFVFV